MAHANKKGRYSSFACSACGGWFDGQISGVASFCPLCGASRQGEVEGAGAAPAAEAGFRVLVCEDSTVLRRAIVKMLAGMGCDVREAVDGAEGIEAFAWKPDLVFTDVDMPEKTGLDLVRALREDPDLSATPVVVLSGRADAKTVSQMMHFKVMAYLLKDKVSSKELEEKMRQCLAAVQRLQGEAQRRVLVVDDSAVYRRAICAVLKSLSCEVLEAADGREALEVLGGELPDILISDIEMPHLAGIELIKQIRDFPGGDRLPVIMLTGQNDDRTMAAALEEGVTSYLLKADMNPTALKAEIQRCMAAAAALS